MKQLKPNLKLSLISLISIGILVSYVSYLYKDGVKDLNENLEGVIITHLDQTASLISSLIPVDENKQIDALLFKNILLEYLTKDIDDQKIKYEPIDITIKDENGKCIYDSKELSCGRNIGNTYFFQVKDIFHKNEKIGQLMVFNDVEKSYRFFEKQNQYYVNSLLAAGGFAIGLMLISLNFNRKRKEYQEKERQEKIIFNEYVEVLVHQLIKRIAPPKSAVERLLNSSNINTEAAEDLNIIRKCIEKGGEIDKLSHRFANLANLKTKNLENKSKVNVADFINNVINTRHLQEKIDTKNIKIEPSIDNSHDIDLVIDSIGVHKSKNERYFAEEALENILDNALDFTPNNSTITIQTKKSNQYLTISIYDQGEGINPEIEGKILKEVGFSYRPGTNKNSTGLGLWFVKYIMENMHKGRVNLKNRPASMGKGAVATLSFPIK